VNHGADIEHQWKNGATPLFFAAAANNVDITCSLLDRGANMEHQDENGCTALFYAIDESCVNVARLLLDCGANIEHQGNKGETALFIAFIENHVDVAHLLMDCGANIDHQRNDGKTVLDLAVEKQNLGFLYLLKEHQLLHKGTPVNITTTSNESAVSTLSGSFVETSKQNYDPKLPTMQQSDCHDDDITTGTHHLSIWRMENH
jgi:uncharacterized protein